MSKSKKIAEEVSEVTIADEVGTLSAEDLTGEKPWLSGHMDLPKVIIGGKELELTLCKPDEVKAVNTYDWYSNCSDTSKYNAEQWSEISNKKELWKVVHEKVEIFISRGSLLSADKIGNTYYWGDSANEKDGIRGTIILLAGQITAEHLSVYERIKIINSSLNGRFVDATSFGMTDSRLHSESNVALTKSYITKTDLSGKCVSVTDTNMHRATLRTGGNISVSDVRCVCENFLISVYPYSANANIDININDTVLTDFKYVLTPNSSDVAELAKEDRFGNPAIEIRRRIDYGYFSSVEQVPFVRVNSDGVLVNDVYFTPEEFMTTSKPVEETQPQFGIGPFQRFEPRTAYPEGCYVGSKMFRKLERIITGNSENKFTPVGSNGNRLVNTLHEQIASRVNLYIEAHLFS